MPPTPQKGQNKGAKSPQWRRDKPQPEQRKLEEKTRKMQKKAKRESQGHWEAAPPRTIMFLTIHLLDNQSVIVACGRYVATKYILPCANFLFSTLYVC